MLVTAAEYLVPIETDTMRQVCNETKGQMNLLILVRRLHLFVKTDMCNFLQSILTCGHNMYLQTCRHESGVKSTVEFHLNIPLGTGILCLK